MVQLPEPTLLIGGKRFNAKRTFNHVNPANGNITGVFPSADEDDVAAAVSAARAALPVWRDLGVPGRRAALWRLADAVASDEERLAQLGTLENGTPLSITPAFCAIFPSDWFRYYAGFVDKIHGRTLPVYPQNAFDYTILRPYGVVALIYGFNGPMAFIGFKVASALAAGNTVVLKPSELAPWTSVRFLELCALAGIPDGVVNLVTGDGDAGRALAAHPGVDKISFTGGSATARSLIACAAPNLTPVSTELGGKSASLLFADADLNTAVPTLVRSALAIVSGQVCLSGTRLLVERSIYDEVVERAAEIAKAIKVGDPLAADTEMGPLISEYHCERVLGVIRKAEAEGQGRRIVGGERPGGDLASGYYVTPTVFTDVDPSSHIGQEEVFGPVVSIMPFDTDAQSVEMANATKYGLAAYIFTKDITRAHRVAQAMDAGFISINTYGLPTPTVPFGGVKASGSGREGGEEGLQEMLVTHNVMVGLGE